MAGQTIGIALAPLDVAHRVRSQAKSHMHGAEQPNRDESGSRSAADGLRPETGSSEAFQKNTGDQKIAQEEQGVAARIDLVFVATRNDGSASACTMEAVRE